LTEVPAAASEPPSLLGITVRRAVTMGRVYLIIGAVLSTFYSAILSVVPGNAFGIAGPLLVPVFAVVGAMGGLMVFTSDRLKGVLEYLIAYGLSPRRLFVNVLVASLVLATVVLVPSVAAALVVYRASGHAVTAALVDLVAAYTVPMSYATAAFAATLGMFWTSLSTPRQGINSPIGLIPIVGIAPPLGTLIATLVVTSRAHAPAYVVPAAAVVLVAVFVLALLARIGSLLPHERLLSPA
jgi:hypothetical protein